MQNNRIFLYIILFIMAITGLYMVLYLSGLRLAIYLLEKLS